MTDPIRRDPTEFLRVLRKMATSTSWQKSMIFASKGRMVGYRLTLDHYNTVLFSQSVWGRALEMIRVIRAMNEDEVQMNGASYYYICNGMANVDHGYNFDFKINHRLEKLQHWRVAIEAMTACEANGFDLTDTMVNSTLITCVIPGMNRWVQAAKILQKMQEEDRKMHPSMVSFYHDCLIRNRRPKEASTLMRLAADQQVAGYEGKWECDVYAGALRRQRALAVLQATSANRGEPSQNPNKEETSSSTHSDAVHPSLTPEEEAALHEEENALVPFQVGLDSTEIASTFRPRVHRQLWYKWHAIANKYRPHAAMKRRQLAPRDSPTGVPAFYRL